MSSRPQQMCTNNRPGLKDSAPLGAPFLRRTWFPVLCLLIVAISTGIQIRSLSHELVIDDNTLVFDADDRGCGANPADCFRGKLFHLYYRPMLTASFAFVQKIHLHNNEARWFHLENLVLHAVVMALSLWLFLLLLRRRKAALIAGAIYALHPVQVCVTTFVGGRTDTLAMLFVTICAIGMKRASIYLRVSSRRPGKRYKLGGFTWVAVSLLAYLAALFTKEQVLPLILLAPLITAPGFSMRNASDNRLISKFTRYFTECPWVLLYLLPIAIFGLASHMVLKGDHLPEAGWSAALHVEMIGRTVWYYVKTFIFPTVTTLHQSTLGAWDIRQPFVEAIGLGSGALWIYLLSLCWRDKTQRMFALWVTLTLLPCLNLVPIPSQFASPYRAAIPLFGLSGLTASLLTNRRLRPYISRSRNVSTLVALATGSIAIVWFSWCITTSITDVPNWHDEFVLMKAEVAADPNYVEARAALANYWSQPPDKTTKPDMQKSLADYDYCIQQLFGATTPEGRYADMIGAKGMVRTLHSAGGLRWDAKSYIPQILRGRGSVYQALDRYDEAIQDFEVVNSATPGDNWNREHLVWCYRTVGDQQMAERSYSDAVESYRAALKLASADIQIRSALVAAYRITGRKDRADAVERMEDRFTGIVP